MKGKLRKTMKRALCYLLVLGMVAGNAIPAQAEGDSQVTTDLTEGLLAYYDFETTTTTETDSGTVTKVLNEKDAATYAGTLEGSATISNEDGTNAFGNSLKIGSALGGMQLENIINAKDSIFSVSMWYKSDVAMVSSSGIKVNLVQAGTIGDDGAGATAGRTILILSNNSTYQTVLTGTVYEAKDANDTVVTVDPTKWQQVTYVYDKENSKAYFYINGVAVSEEGIDLGTTAPADVANMIIGRHRSTSTDNGHLQGLIDEVRVYGNFKDQYCECKDGS